jgi:hypothetical protein
MAEWLHSVEAAVPLSIPTILHRSWTRFALYVTMFGTAKDRFLTWSLLFGIA